MVENGDEGASQLPTHRRPTSRRPARGAFSLFAPIDFYYKNFARGFFLFSAHRKPGNDAHKEIRIIRLYRLTNAIDFYNEATTLG